MSVGRNFFLGILSICFQVRLRHQDVLMFNFCFTHTRVARHQHESTKQFYSNLINHSTFFIDFPPEISQWISNVGWQFFFFFFLATRAMKFLTILFYLHGFFFERFYVYYQAKRIVITEGAPSRVSCSCNPVIPLDFLVWLTVKTFRQFNKIKHPCVFCTESFKRWTNFPTVSSICG